MSKIICKLAKLTHSLTHSLTASAIWPRNGVNLIVFVYTRHEEATYSPAGDNVDSFSLGC